MRFSKAYIKTLKETPKEAEIASHKLMLRAAMIKKLASGIYAYLPLGYRTIRKIENIYLKYDIEQKFSDIQAGN